jgi:Ca-activated chloride channel family protein
MRVNWNLSRMRLISCCVLSSIILSIGAFAQDTRPRRVTKPQDPAEGQTKPTPKSSGQAPAVQTPPPKSEAPQPKTQDEAIRISSNLVSVPVSVTDASGQPVSNLTAQDFRLEEEGKPQEVVTLGEPGKTPLELALLIDVSGSVYERFQFQQQAASQFLREVLKPTDAVSVFSIGLKPKLQQSRVIAIESAVSGIMDISPTKGPTAFFDSVAEAARYLGKTADPGARRVLVVISDGEDNYSEHHKIDSALQETQRADCLFYSINPSGPSIHLNKISLKGQEAMVSLASGTGGAAFLPGKLEDLTAVFRQIAAELQAQYLLGYYSTDERRDGKFRRIAVRVPDRSDLRIRARQGYYAAKS